MVDLSVIHSTFVIERSYPKPPARVFAAFADPQQKRHWFAEGQSHDLEQFEMDFREGGSERSRSRFREGTPIAGLTINSEGIYYDIVPGRRIVMASAMSLGDRRISVALVTIELLPAGDGTDLVCTHQGVFFEGSDGPERREGGWRKLFERLGEEIAGVSQIASN